MKPRYKLILILGWGMVISGCSTHKGSGLKNGEVGTKIGNTTLLRGGGEWKKAFEGRRMAVGSWGVREGSTIRQFRNGEEWIAIAG